LKSFRLSVGFGALALQVGIRFADQPLGSCDPLTGFCFSCVCAHIRLSGLHQGLVGCGLSLGNCFPGLPLNLF